MASKLLSCSDTELPHEFGKCKEDKYNSCLELRQAVDFAKPPTRATTSEKSLRLRALNA